jgi:hypothetical protein
MYSFHKLGLQAITPGRTEPITTQNEHANTTYTKIHPTNTTSRSNIYRKRAPKNKTQTPGLYKPNTTQHTMISSKPKLNIT